ncbi:MAG: PhzF family phenazine biosynthesis protein [candidate division Zixibacteria bacterium]|nr:PhzF family phenazine biosynthesis protein [candidate division Zixibacteria bacterium]MDH3938608.1 PhzF family phenazine biosynthesis protein [candidate division Zixibacteria bacterium]
MSKYYILDVFAEQKYSGNQLAVVRDGHKYADDEMQKIAREFNFSETTFILSETERDGGYDVRIFTPAQELPFAGHPTLGTAYIIQQEIISQEVERVTLNLKAGPIPVEFSYRDGEVRELVMKQLQPEFGKQVEPAEVAAMLQIDPSDVDERFPCLEASTGMYDLIVPLRTLDAQKRVTIDLPKYYELIENLTAKAILTFCPETYNANLQLNVRMFADYFGVPEDPATGSANGCLAGYLVKEGYFESDTIDIRTEQGLQIGRPSVLHLMAEKTTKGIDIRVGGKVVRFAEGKLAQ